ncbi:flavoprotein [Nocardia sp. NPDC101769]|uniref:flavoprotein n=1 Tax=Nocardia sp. NPDC101769 TaxID=3364333 RepID=UPI0038014150
MTRIIVAMSGATGAPLGVRLLEALRDIPQVETHLILSAWARHHRLMRAGSSTAPGLARVNGLLDGISVPP